MKRILAVIAASVALVGFLEDPAHSGSLETSAILAITSAQCGVSVPDVIFMEQVKSVALENGVNVGMALTIVRAQAELMTDQIIAAEAGDEFCQHVQNISFE